MRQPVLYEPLIIRTTDDTVATRVVAVIKEGEIWKARIEVLAGQRNGANGGYWELFGVCRRPQGGVITPIWTDTKDERKTDATWECSFGIDQSAHAVTIRVKGSAGQTVLWSVDVMRKRLWG